MSLLMLSLARSILASRSLDPRILQTLFTLPSSMARRMMERTNVPSGTSLSCLASAKSNPTAHLYTASARWKFITESSSSSSGSGFRQASLFISQSTIRRTIECAWAMAPSSGFVQVWLLLNGEKEGGSPRPGLGLKSQTKALMRAAISAGLRGSRTASTMTCATQMSTSRAMRPLRVRASSVMNLKWLSSLIMPSKEPISPSSFLLMRLAVVATSALVLARLACWCMCVSFCGHWWQSKLTNAEQTFSSCRQLCSGVSCLGGESSSAAISEQVFLESSSCFLKLSFSRQTSRISAGVTQWTLNWQRLLVPSTAPLISLSVEVLPCSNSRTMRFLMPSLASSAARSSLLISTPAQTLFTSSTCSTRSMLVFSMRSSRHSCTSLLCPTSSANRGSGAFLNSFCQKRSALPSRSVRASETYSSMRMRVPSLLQGQSNSESSSQLLLRVLTFWMLEVNSLNLGSSMKLCRIISCTLMSLLLYRFRMIWQVTLNFDTRCSPGQSIMRTISSASGRFPGSFAMMITLPFSSSPRRPALPDICTYSLEFRKRWPPSDPATFLMVWQMTVLVGMLMPIAKVSVAKSTLMSPSENSSSTISFASGSRSPWCTAQPLVQISVRKSNCCSARSSGLSVERAWLMRRRILDFSRREVRSKWQIFSASSLIFFFEKVNTTQGSRLCLLQCAISSSSTRKSSFPSLVSRSAFVIFLMNLSTAVLVMSLRRCSRRLSLQKPFSSSFLRFSSLRSARRASVPRASWLMWLLMSLQSSLRKRPLGCLMTWNLPKMQRECSRGTGRCSVFITQTTRRLVRPTQLAKSMQLGTVALSMMSPMCSGSMMIVSSHTTPRSWLLMQCTSSKITHSMSRIISVPRYRLFRRISVVMITQLACGFMLTSPVTIPTESNTFDSSRYFWFDSAFIGEVQITFRLCFSARAIPYSATTVLPALVCAATNTDSLRSRCKIERFWNSSSSNLYCTANFSLGSTSQKVERSLLSSTAHCHVRPRASLRFSMRIDSNAPFPPSASPSAAGQASSSIASSSSSSSSSSCVSCSYWVASLTMRSMVLLNSSSPISCEILTFLGLLSFSCSSERSSMISSQKALQSAPSVSDTKSRISLNGTCSSSFSATANSPFSSLNSSKICCLLLRSPSRAATCFLRCERTGCGACSSSSSSVQRLLAGSMAMVLMSRTSSSTEQPQQLVSVFCEKLCTSMRSSSTICVSRSSTSRSSPRAPTSTRSEAPSTLAPVRWSQMRCSADTRSTSSSSERSKQAGAAAEAREPTGPPCPITRAGSLLVKSAALIKSAAKSSLPLRKARQSAGRLTDGFPATAFARWSMILSIANLVIIQHYLSINAYLPAKYAQFEV